jgi:hypothetical protein
MSNYIPSGYSQTNDAFAFVIVWAPDFEQGGSLEEEFARLSLGIDSVIQKTEISTAIELLKECKSEVSAVRDLFLANTTGDKEKRKAACKRLQRAYYDLFKKVGQMLKPSGDIGPDDDV